MNDFVPQNSVLWQGYLCAWSLCAFSGPLGYAAFPAPHRYDHVVIVIEENTSFSEVLGNRVDAPFLNTLADGGVSFTEFFAITHPSQPNYIELFSGDSQGITSDNLPSDYPFSTSNLGAALIAAGATFVGYSEDLPAIGDADSTGTDATVDGTTFKLYRRKHNPWANWQASSSQVPPNQMPSTVNRRFFDFPTDFATLPQVAFVVPNQQNDMHDGTTRMADDWLRINLGAYAKWARAHNSLLIVTFDEDNYSGPNKIPTLFYGAALTPNTTNSTSWTLHNLLRTVEDMHGARHSGRAANVRPIAGVFPLDVPVLTTRFRQGVNGYTGCIDTVLRQDAPASDQSASTTLVCDLDVGDAGGNQGAQILIRFDTLFGAASGQVPLNAQIVSAKLILRTDTAEGSQSAGNIAVHRMLKAWLATDTWNSLEAGVSADDVEALATPSFRHRPTVVDAPAIFDVSDDVAAWLAGSSNRGWVCSSSVVDGWIAGSSEATVLTHHPLLEVAYTLPVPTGLAAWKLAKFATDSSPGILLDSADPDGDGMINLLEYVLNSNPMRSSSTDLPKQENSASRATLSFVRNLAATDVTLKVEASSNLSAGSWTTLATRVGGANWVANGAASVQEDAGGYTVITDSIDLNTGTRRFLRLVVEH